MGKSMQCGNLKDVSSTWRDEESVVAEAASGLSDPENYCFFWQSGSPFSQWYKSSYTYNGFTYLCAEQGMMHSKALLFNDSTVASAILRTKSPREMKALGRKVRNFDGETWDIEREKIVEEQNIAKFNQNEQLKIALLATGERNIVEASPYDRIWGIGLDESAAVHLKECEWPGLNLLGKALMRVRTRLRIAESNEGRITEDDNCAED